MDAEPRTGPAPDIEIVENLLAPEVFADEIPLFAIGNTVVTLTLTSLRWDNSVTPARQKRVVIGRLKMPAGAARVLATGLHDFLEMRGWPAVAPEEKARMQ